MKEQSMALKDLSDPDAVLRAVRDYDSLGQRAFLEKYGFGQARKYLLAHGGRHYDSKAIVGVAHLFQTGVLLTSSEFTGGVQGAVHRLQALGFDVVADPPEPKFYSLAKDPDTQAKAKKLLDDGEKMYRAATSTEAKQAYRQASEIMKKARKK
jgi:hypothetical protein